MATAIHYKETSRGNRFHQLWSSINGRYWVATDEGRSAVGKPEILLPVSGAGVLWVVPPDTRITLKGVIAEQS